mgnify:CR=1 FL=1
MPQYDHPPSGETKQQEPYKPKLRGFPMPKTEEFSEGEDAERAKLIEEAMAKVEATLDNERKEKYCEDIVAEIQRIGGVLAENGFGSRPEDKHVAITGHVGGVNTYSRGIDVQYVTAVAARLILKGTYDDSGWQQAQEHLIYKGSDLGITNPRDEDQYNNSSQRGYVISIVTGPPVEVYSDRPLTEERKNSFHGPHQTGTVLVSFAGRYNDDAKVLRVGELGKPTNPKAYERVLAVMQDIEAELLAGEETQ